MISDIKMWTSLWSMVRISKSNDCLKLYQLIQLYDLNNRELRKNWGKATLTGITFGMLPDYLQHIFGDRPKPFATRLFYALYADEATLWQRLHRTPSSAACTSEFSSPMECS